MIKAIFFDFDMTLVNTGTIAHAIFNAFSKHANKKPTERAFDRYMGGRVSDALDMFSKNGADRKELFCPTANNTARLIIISSFGCQTVSSRFPRFFKMNLNLDNVF